MADDLYEVARLATEDVFGPGYWHDPRPGACPGCMICDKEKYMAEQKNVVVAPDDREDEGFYDHGEDEGGAYTAKVPRGAHPPTEDEQFDGVSGQDRESYTVPEEGPTKAVQGRMEVPEMDHANLTVSGEAILFGNRIVGEFDGQTVTLNAGWCRLAGLGLRIDGDSSDRRRVVFERRPTHDHHLSSRA